MRQYIILTFLSLSTFILFAQSPGKIQPKFEYTDIDSLFHAEIKHLNKEKVKFVIANSVIYYGATITDSDTTLIPCDNNPFEIFFLYIKGKDLLVKKLDNHGYFKTEKISAKNIKDFVDAHFAEMEKEKLTSKPNSPKEQIEITNKFKIVNNNQTLEFEFLSEYYSNEANRKTLKYQLMDKIGLAKKELLRKKQKRLTINH